MSETGSIKFRCDRVAVELSRFAGFDELNDIGASFFASESSALIGMVSVSEI